MSKLLYAHWQRQLISTIVMNKVCMRGYEGNGYNLNLNQSSCTKFRVPYSKRQHKWVWLFRSSYLSEQNRKGLIQKSHPNFESCDSQLLTVWDCFRANSKVQIVQVEFSTHNRTTNLIMYVISTNVGKLSSFYTNHG